MKKIVEIIKRKDNIFIFIMLLFATITLNFVFELGPNDELWNFSNIYKMTNGYEIYKDINVIVTPLYFYIGNILFSCLGANFLVFKIYNAIILTFLLFLIYKILKNFKIDKKLSATVVFLIYLCTRPLTTYTTLSLLFAIIGINLLVKKDESAIKQGIILFLIFMSKQNVAAFYLLGYLLYKILVCNNIKKMIWNILKMALTSGTMLFLFLLYLYINNQLYQFINYTILGMKEFAQNNCIPNNIPHIVAFFMQIISQITFIILSNNKKFKFKDDERNNIKIISSFAIFMLMIYLPILNRYHFNLASIISEISIIYFLYVLLKDLLEIKIIDNIKNIAFVITSIIMIIFSILLLYSYLVKIDDMNNYFNNKRPYYGILITKEIKDDINLICNYITEENNKGYEVKIISYYSNLYMNILNRNNGDFDLPFYGNMGKNGQEGMIKNIENLNKNTKILILKEPDEVYQESKMVTDFIRNNYIQKGEIGKFNIYIKD